MQGFRVSKVFVEALFEGPEKAFYFILGDYVERNLQYGIVHADLTPRPAYVAFAAVGRLLNGAKPIGRANIGDDKLKAYVFATHVDGEPRETIVAWSETKPTKVAFPAAEKIYDYLGREMPLVKKVELTRAPVLMLLPRGGSTRYKIVPPPPKAAWLPGKACPIVLQLLGKGDAAQSAFVMNGGRELRLAAYNFGGHTVRGRLVVEGAKIDQADIEIQPGERLERTILIDTPGQATVRLDLGELGEAIVSGRVAASATPKPAK